MYSVFDDQHAAMDAILNGKEMFAKISQLWMVADLHHMDDREGTVRNNN